MDVLCRKGVGVGTRIDDNDWIMSSGLEKLSLDRMVMIGRDKRGDILVSDSISTRLSICYSFTSLLFVV